MIITCSTWYGIAVSDLKAILDVHHNCSTGQAMERPSGQQQEVSGWKSTRVMGIDTDADDALMESLTAKVHGVKIHA